MGRLLALPEWGVPSQSILKMGAASPLPGTGGQRDPKHQHVVQGAGKAFPSLPTKDARFFWSLNLAGQTEQAKAGKGFFCSRAAVAGVGKQGTTFQEAPKSQGNRHSPGQQRDLGS